MTYPPPEEAERQRKRLNALRPWVQAVAAGLGAALVTLVALAIWR